MSMNKLLRAFFKLLSVQALFYLFGFVSCQTRDTSLLEIVRSAEESRIDGLVKQYMGLPAITVTDAYSERSAGGRHDFFSEGDYWWPDPENPDDPYVRRDGLSNPDNFVAHRHAMVRMSRIVGAMASKWIVSGDAQYAHEAMKHLKAWFVDDATKMNPHMLYAQAIMGRYTGRGIGIIDGLHLAEAARSAQIIADAPGINSKDIESIKSWFRELLIWISTHEYGLSEMVHPNNHGTTWAVQAAAYALFVNDAEMIAFCKTRFKEHLLPSQMAANGSFPLELDRTKPYGYSLFNLDAMAFLAQILTLAGEENLWAFTLKDGRGLKKGLEFLFPYIKDKSSWPYEKDVLYWDDWPVRQPALVLGGIAYSNADYIELWKQLDPDPEVDEVQRNLVMRYPLLWMQE